MKTTYDFQPGDIVRFKLQPHMAHYEAFGGYDIQLVRKLVEGDIGYHAFEEKWYFQPLEGPKKAMRVGDMRVTFDRLELKLAGHPPRSVPIFKNDVLPHL